MPTIFDTFVAEGSPPQVNLSSDMLEPLVAAEKEIASPVAHGSGVVVAIELRP